MSLIDALETENKQALGALATVTAQRDRLLRYALASAAIKRPCDDKAAWDARRQEVIDAWWELVQHGDLGHEA